ncbi:hypothetical protein J1614_010562 [Plenodomus biglobosus]|nr:hypothetical protein J1614_010562 [Plenodomus biglobosus]
MTSEETLHSDRKAASLAIAEHNDQLESQQRANLTLPSPCSEAVRGTSSPQEPAVSVDQVRANAHDEIMPVQALEAGILSSLIREAGGVQALVSSVTSIRSLIDQVGDLRELQSFVSNTQLLRASVDEAGGLQGLHNFVSEVCALRSEQQAYARYGNTVGNLDELISKAAKYDKIKFAFAESAASDNAGHGLQKPLIARDLSSATAAAIHPARATLISIPAPRNDAEGDLYEDPDGDSRKPWRSGPNAMSLGKTGTNSMPLGRGRAAAKSINQMYGREISKRRQDHGPPVNTKRPRIDIGQDFAFVQATLASKSAIGSVNDATGNGTTQTLVANINNGGIRIKLEEDLRPSFVTPIASATTMGRFGPPLQSSNQGFEMAGQLGTARLPTYPVEGLEGRQQKQTVHPSITQYPLAIWIGTEAPRMLSFPKDLRRKESVPPKLAGWLLDELQGHITAASMHLFYTMEADVSNCILTYIVDLQGAYRGPPRERMACMQCLVHHRPCALLQSVHGVRTIIFLPLPSQVRCGVDWKDKKAYIT